MGNQMESYCLEGIPKHKEKKINKQILKSGIQKNQKSFLQFQFKTWNDRILPNLRSQQNIQIKIFNLSKDGMLHIDQNNKKLFFQQNKGSKKQNSDYKKRNSRRSSVFNSENKLTISVQKTLKGYYLDFQNQFGYELIKEPKQIVEGSRFLLGGTQYKFIKLIRDCDYGKQKVKSISHFQDQSKYVKTRQFLKSFNSLPQTQQSPICRICMGQQETTDNPIIYPCDCTGSVKYYHLKCWTYWAFKSQTSSQNIYIGNVKKEKCDICKKSLTNSAQYRQMVAALISSVQKIKPPFIVLQASKIMDNFPYYGSIQLSFMILSFYDKKSYIIGRSNDVDVVSKMDKSVSRKNSKIQMINNRIFLSDEQSKHGTYLRVNGTTYISDKTSRSFLYKNSLINVTMASCL